MRRKNLYGNVRRVLAGVLCAAVFGTVVPNPGFGGVVSAKEKAKGPVDVVADWKFGEEGVLKGRIADGDLVIKDQTGNGNNLAMQLYDDRQPTNDKDAAK